MKGKFFIWDWVVTAVSGLAAFPAAYMVGRSVYHWLILGWFEKHTQFWPALGAGTAIVAAVVVEGLGTVSMFEWLTFQRWNNWKAKKIVVGDDGKVTRVLKRGYDLAPDRKAFTCFVAYILVAVALLVVLEYRSDLATFAPVLFPILTGVGALTGGMFMEHKDRLAYHGLSWNWVQLPEDKKEERPEPVPERKRDVPEPSPVGREILYAFRDDPSRTLEQVGQVVGKGKSTVHRYFKELEREGLLSRDGELVAVHWNGNGRHG